MKNATNAEELTYNILFEELANAIGFDLETYTKQDALNVINDWLIKFGYKKERKFFYKILYVCKEKPKTPFGEGVDVFILGRNSISSLIGKKYVHWFKDDKVEISKDEEATFNSSIFVSE